MLVNINRIIEGKGNKLIIDDFKLPTFDEYLSDLSIMFEAYPTEGDQQLHDVRKCLTLIDELEKVADRLPRVPRKKENNNEN